MRLKNINLCCSFAWSPAKLGTPAMIACASYSGSMNDEFNNEAYLEIRLVDVTQTDETDMPVLGSVPIPHLACQLDWSSHSGDQGIIAVSCSNGGIYIYSVAAILKLGSKGYEQQHGQTEGQSQIFTPPLLWSIKEHHSPVRCCQFNPSEPQFLATGDDSGQWWLWSCPDAGSLVGGNRLNPKNVQVIKNAAHNASLVDIQWHPKIAHIIATAASNGQVNVWNLKTVCLVTSLNVSKASQGAGPTCIAWNPTASTQLAVGLDQKHSVVQVWELKRAAAPINVMVGHTGGISGLSWNVQDTSMLASCGGEGLTIWWDTLTGQKLGQLEPETNYMVAVKWCPVLQAVLATSSCEPLLCVSTAQDMSVFKADDNNSAATPPKWMVRPCGASINFALDIVSLVAGTTSTLRTTNVASGSPNSSIALIQLERREIAQYPPGSPERVHWLEQHQCELLAAVSKSRTDRQPILEYLSQRVCGDSSNKRQFDTAEDDDPFAQITQEQQKSYEDRASEHVSMGHIEEAVDVCLENDKYADAFTLAFLRGGGLIAKVHQHYVQYIAKQHPERRHILLAGAVASGDFTSLLNCNIEMSWPETLSMIIAYIGEGFPDACNRLGDALKEKKNYEGAYACYVCGRNVDAAIELYRLQGVPSLKVVRDVILLEEITQRSALSPHFSECLYHCALSLIGEGKIAEAIEYLERAAQIGNKSATVLMDRLRYLVPIQKNDMVAVPYRVEPIPDHPTEACRKYFTSLQNSSVASHPVHQQRQESLVDSRPQLLPPQQHQQLPHSMGAGARPVSQYPNQWTSMKAPMSVQQVPPTQLAPLPTFPTPSSSTPYPPTQQLPISTSDVPPGGTTSSPFVGNPPLHTTSQSISSYSALKPSSGNANPSMRVVEPSAAVSTVRPSSTVHSATVTPPPRPPPPVSPPPGMPYNTDKLHTASATAPAFRAPSHPISQMPPPPPPATTTPTATAPTSIPAPLSSGTGPSFGIRRPVPFVHTASSIEPPQVFQNGTNMMPSYTQQQIKSSLPPPPPSMSSPNGTKGSIMEINVGVLANPMHQKIIDRLQKVIAHLPDSPQRGSVDQAALRLLNHLQAKLLPDDLVQKLSNYVESVGTPNAQPLWREISDSYYALIQPFFNLRFL